ncbi:MAG: DEAD/DEAH box helicase [Propionibacteriaceae bacterium]|jgi:ATP-dependent RNA helicase DeaD|nr:DEAD/DEAH box helicase [Propionibacteriaceae bacterium]
MSIDSALSDTAQFTDLGLPSHLLAAATDLGFDTPTDIQAAAIPALLEGSDLVGVAQTGTGKTAAFGLPMLAAIDAKMPATQGLVLAPTRELALQVASAIESFATTMPKGMKVAAIYGGAPFVPQKRMLAAGAQVVVGTPGRVIDHLERGNLSLDQLRFLVLDEGDEMLRMGFAEEVDTILSQAPAERQTALFSATMPTAIRNTARRHLRHPVEISVTRQASTVVGVSQHYAVVPYRHKIGALARLLAAMRAEATIVFVRTRSAVDDVCQALLERGFNAAAISGDVAQRERERIVEGLRHGQLDVLVATDVAARGLDIDRVGLVVNFDLPHEAESYVHRIGRTGRAGRSGAAFSFINPGERGRLRQIEKTIRLEIAESPIPTAAQAIQRKLAAVLEAVPARLEAGRLSLARQEVAAAIAGGIDPVELAVSLAAIASGDRGDILDSEADEVLDRELLYAAQHKPHQREKNGRNRTRDSGESHHRRPAKAWGKDKFSRSRQDSFAGASRPRKSRRG